MWVAARASAARSGVLLAEVLHDAAGWRPALALPWTALRSHPDAGAMEGGPSSRSTRILSDLQGAAQTPNVRELSVC